MVSPRSTRAHRYLSASIVPDLVSFVCRMTITVVACGLATPAYADDPPSGPTPCEISAAHVPTVVAPDTCDREWGVIRESLPVLIRQGQVEVRQVYQWQVPPNATSMCWEGSFVPGRFDPADPNQEFPSAPQGFRGNIGTVGAWIPGSFFPRAATLGISSEVLVPNAMKSSPTGWQGQSRAVLDDSVDLMTGTPLIQVTDLELPVGSSTFRLTRTRSSLHGSSFCTAGSDEHNKFAFDATDRIWDGLGAGWMLGEAPLLLIDDRRPDVVGSGPATCWLVLDAHRSIPFQWVPDLKRYEAPPRFRARLIYTQTVDENDEIVMGRHGELPDAINDSTLEDHRHGWIVPPPEFKVSLYDGALIYTFVTIWEDVPTNRWNINYLTGDQEEHWQTSSLHDRPLLPDYFRDDPNDSRNDHGVWNRDNNPGFGVPYYALVTRIEDKNGHSVEINYCQFRQSDMDGDVSSECIECHQNCLSKGQISNVVVRNSQDEVCWTLLYSYRHFCVSTHPVITNPHGIQPDTSTRAPAIHGTCRTHHRYTVAPFMVPVPSIAFTSIPARPRS